MRNIKALARRLGVAICVIGGVAAVAVATGDIAGDASLAREPYPRVQPLIAATETILGQPIAYPQNSKPKVTAVIVTLLPGEATGWHTHSIPLYGYVLQGELTVDYGAQGKRVFNKGDSLIEAIGTAHNGHNTGSKIMRILAVFMGAKGSPNAVPVKPAQ